MDWYWVLGEILWERYGGQGREKAGHHVLERHKILDCLSASETTHQSIVASLGQSLS